MNRNENKVISYFLPIAIITLLLTANFIFLEIRFPNYFLFDDNATQFLPFYKYNWDSLITNKTIPLINFHQYLGDEYLGQGQTGVFYLPIYLSIYLSKIVFGDVYSTIDIISILHLITAAICMFLLLRLFRISTIVSLFSSLLWVSFPFITITTRAWVFLSYVAVALPVNFIFIEKLRTHPNYKYALYLSIIKAAFFYQGHIQSVLILVEFEFIFLGVAALIQPNLINIHDVGQTKSDIKKAFDQKKTFLLKFFKAYAFSYISFICLIAPLLLPMYFRQQESMWRSSRLSFGAFVSFSLNLKDFLSSQIFQFRDNVLFVGADSEIYYFGIVNLLFISLVVTRKYRNSKLFTTSTLVAVIALLLSTKAYAILYYLPGLNLFRWPFKYFVIFLFFATISIAAISNSLIKRNNNLIKYSVYMILILNILVNCLITWSNSLPEDVFAPYTIYNIGKNPFIKNKLPNGDGRIFTLWLEKPEDIDIHRYMGFNFATLFNFYHFGGYDPLVSKQTANLTFGLTHMNNYTGEFSQSLLNYLSAWGVKYLVTQNHPRGLRLKRFAQLKLIYLDDDELIYENTGCYPLVYYYDKNRYKLKKVISEPINFELGINEINIYPTNAYERKIAVNVAPLKGFNVYMDGINFGRVNPDVWPIIIKVPQNTKLLKLKYVSYPLHLGLIILTSFTILLVIFYIIQKYSRFSN